MRILMFFLLIVFSAFDASAFGLSADQMYRDMVDVDNGDALTQALERRKNDDDPYLTFRKEKQKSKLLMDTKREAKIPTYKKSRKEWERIVLSVKNGTLSPFDLNEIQKMAEYDDAEAVELLAWMYATGHGINQNLPKAYTYYMQAAQLSIPKAYDNAKTVYNAMSSKQRAAISKF
ncbi:MAG: hypothetical protein MJ250_05365 [Alphaproteobacteria bacterium]|nr:hypothetical protein [Alphaproteobacteria bacterium]